MMPDLELTFHLLTSERWPGIEALSELRDASGVCWCILIPEGQK